MAERNTQGKPSVFITGATGGIGSDCVKQLVQAGYRVFAGVRDVQRGEQLKRSVSSDVIPIRIDITDADSVQSACQEVESHLDGKGLFGLINNAGCIVQGPLELLTMEQIRQQFELNVFGQIAVTQAFLPLLRTNGSARVINIGAVTGKTALPFLGALSASKHAMEAITDALRIELGPWNIHVTMIEPGAIETAIHGKAQASSDLSLKQVPEGRLSLYRNAMLSMQSVIANQHLSPTGVVVNAVLDALKSSKPRTRYAVGKGARMIVTLSHFPDRLRDRLLIGNLGLGKTHR
ncbi:SDR family oxidoreductase [Paenibacillus caui]|uniref:SDR family oxidoreductase n=1 Tax=Paenibacillus caui TaxID=2873927 RepID=UPI001CA91F88|nr:SDR family oxidoreductase [Paenibacillus caui]